MKIKQTDYAFPFTYEDEKTLTVCSGMELRDYFAAKAMQGIVHMFSPDDFFNPERVTKISYQIADAMMKARKQ